MATIIDKSIISEKTPTSFSLHLDITLNISPKQARRRANGYILDELGTGLIGREPELVIEDELVRWRVPIELSPPRLGNLGQVGMVEVDAQTGDILTSTEEQEAIIRHANFLSYGATTLQSK